MQSSAFRGQQRNSCLLEKSFFLGQGLHSIRCPLFCMGSHFLPDSWLHPEPLGAVFVASLHSRAQPLNYQQLPEAPGADGGGGEVLQPAEQVRTAQAGRPHAYLLRGRDKKGRGWDQDACVRLGGKMRPCEQPMSLLCVTGLWLQRASSLP